MTQTNRTKSRIVIAALLAGVALPSLPAFAQTSAPAAGANQESHMMPNGDVMKPGMMMDHAMHQKMSRMMDNCNRMMESMAPDREGAPAPSAPTHKG